LEKEYTIHFPNGTVFRTSFADSAREAKEYGWVVELNAMAYNLGHGFKNKTDFMKRIVVTKEVIDGTN